MPAEAFVLGHVDRFYWRKNHPFVVDVAAALFERASDARLLLVGDGPDQAEIEAMVADRGMASRVICAGARADVPLLLKGAMDVFVFPSHHEGLRMAVVEAQAAGLPCVLANALPEEIDVVPALIHRLSLEETPTAWAERILEATRLGAGIARASPARGQEARPGHPVHPRAAPTGATLSPADQDRPGHFGLSAPGCDTAGRSSRFGRRALAGQGPALSALDRADHRADRAAGSGRRAGAASEKLVSLFEPHVDIIRKGREVAYGHKLNLTTGRSGLILDVVIEAGTPADSERLLPMLERHSAFYGRAPRQAAADGSFASRDNLHQAKAQGVRNMAFHKRGGLKIEDMVRSRWVYCKLRNCRAGIEAAISCLKRA